MLSGLMSPLWPVPKQVKARVDARNALETYCYNMKQTIEDKLGDKLDEDDKDKVLFSPFWCTDPAHTWQWLWTPGSLHSSSLSIAEHCSDIPLGIATVRAQVAQDRS